MSYSIVKGLNINKKDLIIKWNVASSNVCDGFGRRCFDKVTQEYKTEKEFNEALYSIANGILSGELHISNKHSISRRLEEIINRDLIFDKNPKGSGWSWFEVVDSEETLSILRGDIKIPREDYIIKSENSDYELKKTPTGMKLTVGKGTTVFPSKRLAEIELNNIKENTTWYQDYRLKLSKV